MKFFHALMALAIVGLVSISSQAFAQGGSATIQTDITSFGTADLAFGTIAKGATATVLSSDAAAGTIAFSGDADDNVTISVPATFDISTTSGAGSTMTVTITRASMVSNTTSAQGTASAMDASSGSATVALSSDASGDGVGTDGLGQVYTWFGGTVSPTATQQRGTYNGTVTITAAYSN